ncbi:MAG: betaine/proline/choline family ABC transporter ATP-binding protein [Clostridium sp.]|nr:betaine/proline/choline family ABC transporter ATP-binding protein [Clostridium sp.]
MIKFENVSKVYDDDFHALKEVNLEIEKGELFVLIGPSGCGKTTTMKMINRLIETTSGNIFIDGKSIKDQDPVILRRDIGYVIQQIGLLPHMTISENVALVPKLKKEDPKEYMETVWDLMNMVGLDPETYADRYPTELSGGQQQRVGVIRALASDPSIILMDEPFSALDPISREQLQEDLVNLQEEIQKTIVFVTHDMDEALKIADRICIMKEGEVVQTDTPERILRHPKNDFVTDFIGEERLRRANGKIFPEISQMMTKAIVSRPNRGLAQSVKHLQKNKVDSLIVVDKGNKYLGIASAWDIYKNFDNEDLTIRDLMKTEHTTININEETENAIVLLNNAEMGFIPVIDDNNVVLGVINNATTVEVITEDL